MLIARLKRSQERKLLNGYPWVFRDEVEELQGNAFLGSEVNVFSSEYRFIGKGLYNPFSHRSIMFLTTKEEPINGEFILSRLIKAVNWRQKTFTEPYYRLFHSEADGLPGFIADRYGDIIVVQFRNAIMELFKNEIIKHLIDIVSPITVYERSDFQMQVGEKIQRNVGLLYGAEPPASLTIKENGISYLVDVVKSQKTGFFYDQRDSRLFARRIVSEFALRRGLDLFTYTGGFALNMALSGAQVTAVDKSSFDLELGKQNAALNNLSKKIEFLQSDAFDYLETLEKREQFDIVIIDPPSLIKGKHEIPKGIKLLKRLVNNSLKAIRNEGVIGLCSCAYNLTLDHLVEALRKASTDKGIFYRFLGVTYQSRDHPWLFQIPETLYLKCLWAVVEKR
ncbi:MAG: class I SAM-dependent rRNA methyltransferase [Thermotogae bacterium]|uniref:Class I SAM-dependent rRNA methyltransferase n=1 Tax=Kosmotoga arenicorallina TaxID=688066 RepID=A0A7C5HPG1_9BACT|nr:class I SAM-dependent rRNA methyltransferase [Kosmotoga sp.]MCD6159184.1 class I SAM-dependent rRNA methyltransferase [Kosmotoga sp.]RKX51221.1 MAG: class I SAM-dependent rRNA methyltransferase [Thermotogota bacterium]HHF08706.1 class I SAM-dependent rRNA methyltransferase [Kosmotoga arenicorallina]